MSWAQLLKKFRHARVLVVGDICLDRWCRYDPSEAEVSHETGIARIGVVQTEVTPGAGGTVANNLASLGAGRVSVLGAIGQDGFGFELERALTKRRIDYSLLVATPDIQTFTYTKVINGETGIEDRPRVDFINTHPLPSEVEDQLIANFSTSYQHFDAIFVSDQAETGFGGVVTPAFREVIADVAERNRDRPVLVDSRRRIDKFRHVFAKPNRAEAEEASVRLFGQQDLPRLRSEIGDRPMIVTQGSEGSLIVSDEGEKRVAAPDLGEPVDVCGAGDAFGAGLLLALQAGASISEAAKLGSLVASVTVLKAGTGTATPEEVLAAADSVGLAP